VPIYCAFTFVCPNGPQFDQTIWTRWKQLLGMENREWLTGCSNTYLNVHWNSNSPTCSPVCRKRTLSTPAMWPWKVRIQLQSVVDHNLIVLSPLAVATTLSIGENWQSQTPRLCPFSVPCKARSVVLHSLTCLSWDPVAISESFGETVTMLISWNQSRNATFYVQ
jgi:hypothetical protein